MVLDALCGCCGQGSAFGWDNTYMVECLDHYPGKFKAIGLVDPESPDNARDLER
jgi:hypothetical protein